MGPLALAGLGGRAHRMVYGASQTQSISKAAGVRVPGVPRGDAACASCNRGFFYAHP